MSLGQRQLRGKPPGQADAANGSPPSGPASLPMAAIAPRCTRSTAAAVAPAALPSSPAQTTSPHKCGAGAACATKAALTAAPLSPRISASQRQAEQLQQAGPALEPANGNAKHASAGSLAEQHASSVATAARHEQQQQQPLPLAKDEACQVQDRSACQHPSSANRAPDPGTASVPDAATAEGHEPCASQQAQQQQPQPQPTSPAPPQPLEHEHNTRRSQRQTVDKLARRKVSFAPGPWGEKFTTRDGHPDHEGQLARQRRSSGVGWGRDLTPSAVHAVEAELGEDCRPSIDRLKRRVGLLPLRKRPLDYYVVINSNKGQQGGATHNAGTRAGAAKAAIAAAIAAAMEANASEGAAGSSSSSSAEGDKGAGEQAAKKQRGSHRSSVAAPAPDDAPKQQLQMASPATVTGAAGGKAAKPQSPVLRLLHAGTSMRPGPISFSRKRLQPEPASPNHQQQPLQQPQQQQQQPPSCNGTSKRASQRLGGLFGPVGGGLAGGFSKRGHGGSN